MEVYLTIISIYFWENVIKNVNVGARIPKTLAFNIHLTSILDPILIFFLMNFCLSRKEDYIIYIGVSILL